MRASGFPVLPLSDVVIPRHEPVRVIGALGDWQAITIKFSGEVLPRERAEAFKGAMFAAYRVKPLKCCIASLLINH